MNLNDFEDKVEKFLSWLEVAMGVAAAILLLAFLVGVSVTIYKRESTKAEVVGVMRYTNLCQLPNAPIKFAC